MFAALADGAVNIHNITTSEIKISCIIDQGQGPAALRLVHDAFELGKAPVKPAKAGRAKGGKRK
jgi:aspartate kinase